MTTTRGEKRNDGNINNTKADASGRAVTAPEPSCTNHDIALLRLPQVLSLIPVSRSHWWAGVASGRYPSPVKLSPRCVAWKSADIRALIASL